jgi:plastocyanin
MIFVVFTLLFLKSEVALSRPQSHKVSIENMKFIPSSIEVQLGDEIIWTNKDIVPHTVTAEPPDKPLFDSGQIDSEKNFRIKVTRKGVIHYLCRIHPQMNASIRVAPASK